MEIVRQLLNRSDRLKRLNVFVHLDPEQVLGQARAIDARRQAGEMVGRLAGVPVAIKDVLCVDGEPTTCGSRILCGFRPPYDATVISKLRAAGAIIFGKTNMDEFAMGSSTENSAYGPTLNPWDETRVPGGSSGGSAVAVAADLAPLAAETDYTGGSIRQPAAVWGVVGLKPTYGRVSRYGLIAYASSLDQVGPFAHDLADTALLLGVIAGRDPSDSTSVPEPVADYGQSLEERPASLRVGVVPEFFGDGLDPEVASAVQEAIQVYERAGATIKEVSLPHSKYGIPAYYIVAPGGCSSNLSRYDGTTYGHRATDFSPKYPGEESLPPMIRMMMASRAEGFGAEVKRRIMLGTFVLSAGYSEQYYNKALQVRRKIRNDFDSAFKEVDVLVGPTSPTPAFKLGERTADPLAMYLSDIYTITANLAGIPGISIPCGLTAALPIGLQLLGALRFRRTCFGPPRFSDARTDWHLKRAAAHIVAIGAFFWTTKSSSALNSRSASNREQDVLGEWHRLWVGGQHWTDPVYIGARRLPGTLPVMNRKAFELALKTAVGLGAQIAPFTKWDRKNYYYPDLPKNYQISQYDLPFSRGGKLEIPVRKDGGGGGSCRLTRVHLEEDTGKLTHGNDGFTEVDLNRAGIPLLEIVTEPDIRNSGGCTAELP